MNKISIFIKKKLIEWFNITPIKTTSVFTPAKVAEANYIPRPDIESQLIRNINTPGKQLLIFGNSGSGKTTTLRRVLQQNNINYIRTQCETATTFEQLILNAFDALQKYVVVEKSNSSSYTISGSIASEYYNIKSQLDVHDSQTETQKLVPLLPPQLTPQKLATFYGEGNIIWVIEDFHKVETKEKQRIADILKIFVDNANYYEKTKIICIGACDTVNDLLTLDPNLKNRTAEIQVHFLSENTIRNIIKRGFELLNIEITEQLENNLVYYSARLGSLAHQMCLDICNGLEIYQRSRRKVFLKEDVFTYAVESFIKDQEPTFCIIYDKITKNQLGWYILKTLAHNYPTKLNVIEITNRIHSNKQKNRYTHDEVKTVLKELCEPQYGVITYYINSDKYLLSSPFWAAFLKMQHYKETQSSHKSQHHRAIQTININERDAIVEKQILELLKKLYIQEHMNCE